MKKFKCTVTRTDEYIVEFDENLLDQEWMDNFKRYFYDFDTIEEHAEHLAQSRARLQQDFIEGYGAVLIDGKKPWHVDGDNYNKGINIKIISEDKDCEVDVMEFE